ncbi:MAG: DciA family protein [Candidatus Doudnabacteria bacterium]|nr:DciA family protein [Candidatus Doudnabacteria bacterium]
MSNKKDSRGFSRIDKVLNKTAKQYHLEQAMSRYKVIKNWQNAVSQFFDEAANLTKAVDFQKGVLKVACLSRELAVRLKLFVPRIIEIINRLVGRPVVYAIAIES